MSCFRRVPKLMNLGIKESNFPKGNSGFVQTVSRIDEIYCSLEETRGSNDVICTIKIQNSQFQIVLEISGGRRVLPL